MRSFTLRNVGWRARLSSATTWQRMQSSRVQGRGLCNYTTTTTRLRIPINGQRDTSFRSRRPRKLLLKQPLHLRTLDTMSSIQALPPYFLAPTVFVGLFLTLWVYKCITLVAFQEKIIYMPYIPPFARRERVEDYVKERRGVVWREIEVRSADGVRLGGCVGEVGTRGAARKGRRVVICYFHGNGGSLPPRLPMLSAVLTGIEAHYRRGFVDSSESAEVEVTLVALSYRGYWTSSGRPTQKGIELDAQALLRRVNDTYVSSDERRSNCFSNCERLDNDTTIILWGQSLGAGVATTAAATYNQIYPQDVSGKPQRGLPVAGLILETPFTSIASMLLALYPQKWLPYRYLGVFLRSHWDSETALRRLAASEIGIGKRPDDAEKSPSPQVLILEAGKDEVVPAGEAAKLEDVCRDVGLEVQRSEVGAALHNEATSKREGRETVARWVGELERRGVA